MSTMIEIPRFHMRPGTEERSRRERWRAKGTARVTHPVRGTVVVPCSSKLAAIMNAAEVWQCDWTKLRDAEVRAPEPRDLAVKMPYIKEENA